MVHYIEKEFLRNSAAIERDANNKLKESSLIAKERKRIIEFTQKHGLQAAKDAFGLSKTTYYRWCKLYYSGGIKALSPQSRKPHNLRAPKTDKRILDFIIAYRTKHPRVTQETIKPHLDAYCLANNIKTISVATIGRTLKRLKLSGFIKLSLKGKTGRLYEQKKEGIHKERRKGYKPVAPGNLLQTDAVKFRYNNNYLYLINAIDLQSRHVFSKAYADLNSANAKEFIENVQENAPYKIEHIQTDNGSEFCGDFYKYLDNEKITQYFNYPRTPKSNAYIERFNRTVQEQFILNHYNEYKTLEEFNENLSKYINWYNYERPHSGLKFLTPMQYLKLCNL